MYAVASRPTVDAPLACTAAAVVSAMWTKGTSIAATIASATLCIVFVQSTISSAPGPGQRTRLLCQPLARLVPLPRPLQLLDLREFDRAQQAVGRVQPAEAVAHRLVDQAVVLGGGLPAHPAE